MDDLLQDLRVGLRALIVAQVAFAFVLLVGAGLLVASFRNVLAVDPGFRPDGVVTASVVLPRARYRDNAAMSAFLSASLEEVRRLPGVASAGTTGLVPLSGNVTGSVILAEGYQMKPGESAIAPALVNISPGYFEAMGATLVTATLAVVAVAASTLPAHRATRIDPIVALSE